MIRFEYTIGMCCSRGLNLFCFVFFFSHKQDVGAKSNAQRSSLSISSHDSSKDGAIEHPRPNHRKNRQAPKPPVQQLKSLDESLLNNTIESASNLEIRAPSELLLSFPTGLRTQWRHSAEILITGSVTYEVNVRTADFDLFFISFHAFSPNYFRVFL